MTYNIVQIIGKWREYLDIQRNIYVKMNNIGDTD